MIPTASTTALALHDIGLATSFGGNLFGRLALHPAMKNISDEQERGEVVHSAWQRFNALNLIGHGLFAVTWFVGRGMLGGRQIDESTRGLVLAKDILIGTALASGITSGVAGMVGMRDPNTGAPAPLDEDGDVAETAPEPARISDTVTKIASTVNLLSLAGVLATTALLVMKAGDSHKWSFISKLLP